MITDSSIRVTWGSLGRGNHDVPANSVAYLLQQRFRHERLKHTQLFRSQPVLFHSHPPSAGCHAPAHEGNRLNGFLPQGSRVTRLNPGVNETAPAPGLSPQPVWS